MFKCHGFDVWSFVMSLVPSATMPFLVTEKQVQQAKYFNQGHHTLNRRQGETELGIRLSQCCHTSWVTGNTMKNRHTGNKIKLGPGTILVHGQR